MLKFNELRQLRDLLHRAGRHRRGQRPGREGYPVDTDDLGTISPYITRTIRRFGSWVVDLTPPTQAPATRLDLESRGLFA